MIIYIAGPMRGYKGFNYPSFTAAAEYVRNLGHTVLNPAVHPLGLPEDAYMDMDLAMLRAADAVALLPGWSESTGAATEIAYARYLRHPFIADFIAEVTCVQSEPCTCGNFWTFQGEKEAPV